jgi:hypothetical protein
VIIIINSNLVKKIPKRLCEENILIADYFITRIPNSNIYISKIVGRIYVLNYIKEGKFYPSRTPLCQINLLGIVYILMMEEDGILLKKYVKQGQIIDYNYPLFLILKTNQRGET